MEHSMSDAYSLLNLAKISNDSVLDHIQTLYFQEGSFSNDLRLLELDTSTLKLLEQGEKLIFRGEKDDSAVLCSNSVTFDVKEAETSNTMLLLPSCSLPDEISVVDCPTHLRRQVCGMFNTYLELRRIPSKCYRLKDILSGSIYSGPENEHKVCGTKKYDLNDLLNVIQASEEELRLAIQNQFICLIDGFYRLLDFDYVTKVVSEIFNFVQENSWSWLSVPYQETLNALQELEPRVVVEACCGWFGNLDENGEYCCFDDTKVIRFFAEVLLKPAGKFHYQEFMDAWRLSLPEGMKSDLKLIQGLAIVNKKSVPANIQYFPVEALPANPADRFDSLFKAKQIWLLDDIKPYLEHIASAKLDVGALLAKFARCSTVNGTKQYTSKKIL